MISDRAKKALENLGLTSYEIKVYLSLLENGPMTASNTSKKSNVPYSKIYEVINSLEDKGWLESDSSRPQKFIPKSPVTAIEIRKRKIENDLKENQNTVVNELLPAYEKSGIREKPDIWVVIGIYNIASKINEIIQTCQYDLLIAIPQIAENIAKQIQPMLRTLYDKGVKISVLASEATDIDTVRAISRIAEVRLKGNMFGGGVIGDGKQVLILLGEGKENSKIIEPVGIWADHFGLARFAKDYFNYLWADAYNHKK